MECSRLFALYYWQRKVSFSTSSPSKSIWFVPLVYLALYQSWINVSFTKINFSMPIRRHRRWMFFKRRCIHLYCISSTSFNGSTSIIDIGSKDAQHFSEPHLHKPSDKSNEITECLWRKLQELVVKQMLTMSARIISAIVAKGGNSRGNPSIWMCSSYTCTLNKSDLCEGLWEKLRRKPHRRKDSTRHFDVRERNFLFHALNWTHHRATASTRHKELFQICAPPVIDY